MTLPFAACRLIAATAALSGLSHQELWGQRRDATAPVPESFRGLEGLGELRLRHYSIHGYAPLVVLLTEAGKSASDMERRHRHRVTRGLVSELERLGVSIFSLDPKRHSSNGSAGDQMNHAASALAKRLGGMDPSDRPQVVIGFAEGASAAARVLLRDSLSAALVALVPGSADVTTRGPDTVWEELLRPSRDPRPVLVLESMCNGAASALPQAGFRERQTILMLPQYDGWLSPRMTSACPATPVQAGGMDYGLTSILIDWLRRNVRFPE